MYQTEHTQLSGFQIAIFVAIVVSIVVMYFVIKFAVKSAVQDELSKSNALLEWHLAKQYPGIMNIAAKAGKYAALSREYQENYTMLQTGARKEDKYNKIKEAIEKEIVDYLK